MIKVAAKFNRCLEFTLPSGKVITVKVVGEKDAAKKDAAELLSALSDSK